MLEENDIFNNTLTGGHGLCQLSSSSLRSIKADLHYSVGVVRMYLHTTNFVTLKLV